METEKFLTIASLVVAGLVILVFLLDAILGFPFRRVNLVMDILFIIGGAFILWQGLLTYREFR